MIFWMLSKEQEFCYEIQLKFSDIIVLLFFNKMA